MNNRKFIKVDANTELPAILKVEFDAWDTLPKSPNLPFASDFTLERVSSKLLPWAVLVDVVTDPLDFRYRFWGTERARLIGEEMTGRLVSSIKAVNMRDGNRKEYEMIFRGREPLLCLTPITKFSGASSSRLSLRLPLSDDGVSVSRIFSVVDPGSIPDELYKSFGTMPKRGL